LNKGNIQKGQHQSDRLFDISNKLQTHTPGLMGEKRLTKYAVLVPLVQTEESGLAVLFEKRASTLKRQAGEICFPGGRIEQSDGSPWKAARRETSEELGISPEQIDYLGELDTLVMPSQLCIYSFVGLIREPEIICPNPDEVEEFFLLPLERLLGTRPAVYHASLKIQPGEDYPYHLIPNGTDYPWRTGKVSHLFYQVDDRVIWGLTARILEHFLELIGREDK
jgi:coenzyme A diphosphatase NUDT7